MVEPLQDRAAVRAQIEALLVEDARLHPAFAMARKNAVLAGYEAATTRAPSRFVATTAERFLRALHSYEAMRGGARTPSAESTAIAERVFSPVELSAYERARHLSLPVYPARPATPPEARRPIDAPRFPHGVADEHPKSLLEAMAFAAPRIPTIPVALPLTYLMGWVTPMEMEKLSVEEYEALAICIDDLEKRVNFADDAWLLGALANRLGTAPLKPDTRKRILSLRHWAGTFAHSHHEPDPFPHAETKQAPAAAEFAPRESALAAAMEHVTKVLLQNQAIVAALLPLERQLTATAWAHDINDVQRTDLVALLAAIARRLVGDTPTMKRLVALSRLCTNYSQSKAILSGPTWAQLRSIQDWKPPVGNLGQAIVQLQELFGGAADLVGKALLILEGALVPGAFEKTIGPYQREELLRVMEALSKRLTTVAQRDRLATVARWCDHDLVSVNGSRRLRAVQDWRSDVATANPFS